MSAAAPSATVGSVESVESAGSRVGSRVGTRPIASPGPDSVSGSVPDPFDDADALTELEHEIATLAAHIHAATHRLLVLVADFDRRRGWELGGHRSCADWLHVTTGIDRGAAREKVRTAKALVGLPETSARMARGELSYSAVRALTRVATPDCEAELLEAAECMTTAELERFVRMWRYEGLDEAARERALHRSRRLSVFPDDQGMYVVNGRLPAEVGALLMRAVEAAADALYREESGASRTGSRGRGRSGSVETAETTAKQRRADALGLIVERAMAAGFGGEVGGGEAGDGEAGDGSDVSAETPATPLSGTRAERYQVVLHVEPATLAVDNGVEATPAPRSHLEDGTRVSAETSRRLSCDAAVIRVARRSDGSVLDVGRRTRTVPPALRRALEIRDRGCRWPGCGLRFTDGHHVRHWADGGETRLDNLLLLCRFHHRKVHEEGWRIEFWGKQRFPAFIDPNGDFLLDPRPRDQPRDRARDRARDQSRDPLPFPERDRARNGACHRSRDPEREPRMKTLRPAVRLPDRPIDALVREQRLE